MSFLEDFDSRAQRKPGEPARMGDTPEDNELLDFADLIRSRQGVPQAGARERLLARVRANEPQTSGKPVVDIAASSYRRHWLGMAGAALLALVAGLVSVSSNTELIVLNSAKGQGEVITPLESNPPKSKSLPAANPIFASTRTPNEEFANLSFPTPQTREGDGAVVETSTGKDIARLVRVQGLVMYQKKGEVRWRVANRGQVFTAGDSIRVSKRLESCGRILGPDGSAISISSEALARYDGPRQWNLTEGNAYFEVAQRKDSPAFTVETPHGYVTALGTTFSLDAGRGPKDEQSSTLCWVEEGKVSVASRDQKLIEVSAGTSALLQRENVRLENVRYSKGWLAALERVAANDHGIGQLVAKAEKANEHLPLEVKSHSVSVTVIDQVARTFVDEVFVNNTDRRMEGVFYYPLPADATISEFAMYVGDQRIVGEVLEQQHARQIFEYIVRQQRDPALLEYAGGNLFKMRIFPIEPHSEKRIQLGYTQILPRSNGKVTYTYPLYSEMLLKNPLLDLRIEFRALSTPGLSNLASPTHAAPSAFNEDRTRGALSFRAKNYSPTRDFTVTYNVSDGAECVAFTNKRPDDPLGYFMLQLCPKVALPQRTPPQRVLVVVDGSASSGSQDYAVASEFAASAADVSSNWEFGVLRGGQKPRAFGALTFTNADTSFKVREFLQNTQPLGATDLLETFRKAAAMVQDKPGAQLVYVGDGIDTVSELSGPALVEAIVSLFKGKEVKVSTVATGSSYDRAVLQGLAAKLGGTFTRVEGASDVHSGVGQVFDSFYRPMLWDVLMAMEGAEISHVYPEYIGSLAAGDTAVVLGRFDTTQSLKVRVKVAGDMGGQWTERQYDVALSADEKINRFLPRLWAKAHIDNFLGAMGLGSAEEDARIKQDIIKISMTYQIMSPYTAFLVLESEEDYARFGIKRKMKMMDWNGEGDGRTSELELLKEANRVTGDKNVELRDNEVIDELPLVASKEKAFDEDYDGAIDHFEYSERASTASEPLFESLNELKSLRERKHSSFYSFVYDRKQQSRSGRFSGGLREWYSEHYSPSQFQSLVFHAGSVLQIQIDQPLRSIAEYQRVLAAKKETLSTHLNLSLALERVGRFEEALKALGPVLVSAPAHADLRLQEGVLCIRVGKLAEGKAAFAKAVELSAENDKESMRERIASIYASLGQLEDAAAAYGFLAQTTKNEDLAARCAQRAVDALRSPEKAQAFWDDLLQRWPRSALLMSAAGQSALANRQFERGVNLIRTARGIQPSLQVDLIQEFVRRSDRDGAIAEFHAVIASGSNTHIQNALSSIAQQSFRFSIEQAIRLLREGTAVQAWGATLYLQSNGNAMTRAVYDALTTAMKRPEYPDGARFNAFYALHNGRSYGKTTKFEPEAVLGKLWHNPSTAEQWSLAAQAVGVMSSYGFAKQALEVVRGLKRNPKCPAILRGTLLQLELVSLNALGRLAEADEILWAAIPNTTQAGQILPAVQTMLQAWYERSELDAAVKLADGFAARFPEEVSVEQVYTQVCQRLLSAKKYDTAQALLARIEKVYPENAYYQQLHARVLIAQKKYQEAAEVLRAILKRTEGPPPTRTPAALGPRADKEDTAEFVVAFEIDTTQQDRNRWAHLRESALRMLAQVSAQDEELRKRFLSESKEGAKREDPADREWTEASLTALKAAGDTEGYLRRLQGLCQSEPDDRIWPRRYASALAENRNFAAACEVLKKLLDAEPRDGEVLSAIAQISVQLKDGRLTDLYLGKLFEILKENPTALQQFANQWQEQKPAWAQKAWKTLMDSPTQRGYAAYRLGELLQRTGDEDGALDAFYGSLTATDSSYASQAWQALVTLGTKEQHLRELLKRNGESLKNAAPTTTFWLRLLEYRLQGTLAQSLEGVAKAAAETRKQKALEFVLGMALPQNSYNLGSTLLAVLQQDGYLELAEKYVLESGGNLELQSRRSLLEQHVNWLSNNPKEFERSIRLYKSLLAIPETNQESQLYQYFNLLIRADELTAAEDVLRNELSERSVWNVVSAWTTLSHAYTRRKQHARALELAYESWKSQRDNSNYGDQLVYSYVQACEGALQEGQGKIDAELKRRVAENFREIVRAHFSADGPRTSYLSSLVNICRRLEIQESVDALADEAAKSLDSSRIALAAAYCRSIRDDLQSARALYRKAIAQQGEAHHGQKDLLIQFYSALIDESSNIKGEWSAALEVLETLKAQRAYNETQYLIERGRCLNRLNRIEESRAAFRSVLATYQSERQNYGQAQSLAYQIQSLKDWVLSAEAWELAIRQQRTNRYRASPSQIAEFYRNCANAYAQQGEKDKAMDCYLRALSVIPRTDGSYSSILESALEEVLRGSSLDKTVEEYEKSVAAAGGAEKPHLRIAFAEGYRKEKNTFKMLRHLSIAANLLPKDMTLRQQVIDGYKGLGNIEAALEAYREWAKFDAQSIEIYRGMGDFLESLGRRDEALLAWATMAEIRPREAEGYRAYAQKLIQVKDYAGAAVALRHALRYRPTEYSIAEELAAVYGALNQTEKIPALWTTGEARCRKAIEDFADDPQPWLNLAKFLRVQKRLADTRALYREILKREWPRFRNETMSEATQALNAMPKE